MLLFVIQLPVMYTCILYCIVLVQTSQQIEENSGVSLDSQSTLLLPEFMPPMMLIFPWVAKVSRCEYSECTV